MRGAFPLAFKYCQRKEKWAKWTETELKLFYVSGLLAELTVVCRFGEESPTVHDSRVSVGSAGWVGLQSLDLFNHLKTRNDDTKDNVDSANKRTILFDIQHQLDCCWCAGKLLTVTCTCLSVGQTIATYFHLLWKKFTHQGEGPSLSFCQWKIQPRRPRGSIDGSDRVMKKRREEGTKWDLTQIKYQAGATVSRREIAYYILRHFLS